MFTSKNKILTGVSAVALLACVPAFAEDARSANQDNMPHYTAEQAKEGIVNGAKDIKRSAEQAADEVGHAAKEAYKDMKNELHTQDVSDLSSVQIEHTTTAAGMLGQPVYNQDGDRVAKVKDIILDQEGHATMIVLADGQWTGAGKLVALDYKALTKSVAEGDVIAPLTEEMIDQAAPFSYKESSLDNAVKVVPQNGYSVAALLDADLVDPNGETLAVIDNITFRDGSAERLVVGFNQILGMGGNKAAVEFSDPSIVNQDGGPQFKLSLSQAEQFKAYKDTALN